MRNILRKNRSKFLQVFFSLALFALASTIYGQSPAKHLTLDEAIALSLKNSHQLRASMARVQQAQASLSQAKENRLPDASVSASYLRLASPNLSLKVGKPVAGNPDSAGTHFPSVHQATYGIASITLPLFAGGKINHGIDAARHLHQASVFDITYDSQTVILSTIEAYANLYKANSTVDVIQENLSQSRYRDSVLLRLENNGLLARNDRLKANLQTSDIELTLMDAENSTRIAMMNLDLMLGLSEGTQIIADSSAFHLPGPAPKLSDIEAIFDAKRGDLLALKQRVLAAQAAIGLARADYYPNLALSGGYIAAYVPGVLTLTNAINAGIGLHYNISSLWKTKSRIDEAKGRLKEVTENEAALHDAIMLQLHKNFENYLLQQKKISVFQSAVEQAEENYRISKNKFDNQLLSTTDLLDANVLLLQSQINLTAARADLFVAYESVLQAAGLLNNDLPTQK